MNISERRIGSVVILDLQGKILLGDGDIQLKEYIARLIEQGERRILLNMAGVPYMDSSGLGEVVRCRSWRSRPVLYRCQACSWWRGTQTRQSDPAPPGFADNYQTHHGF